MRALLGTVPRPPPHRLTSRSRLCATRIPPAPNHASFVYVHGSVAPLDCSVGIRDVDFPAVNISHSISSLPLLLLSFVEAGVAILVHSGVVGKLAKVRFVTGAFTRAQ